MDDASSTSSERYEKDVTVLNRCFDDIERFIARLQHAAAARRELERRRKYVTIFFHLLSRQLFSLIQHFPSPSSHTFKKKKRKNIQKWINSNSNKTNTNQTKNLENKIKATTKKDNKKKRKKTFRSSK